MFFCLFLIEVEPQSQIRRLLIAERDEAAVARRWKQSRRWGTGQMSANGHVVVVFVVVVFSPFSFKKLKLNHNRKFDDCQSQKGMTRSDISLMLKPGG